MVSQSVVQPGVFGLLVDASVEVAVQPAGGKLAAGNCSSTNVNGVSAVARSPAPEPALTDGREVQESDLRARGGWVGMIEQDP